MDYKSKLQTNNTALEGNNVDLQTILNTINSLPEATAPINLDSEITAQDAVIAQIQTALEGKAAGGSAKTTKTIHIDWSEDVSMLCIITYISNSQMTSVYAYSGIETIEAEGGMVVFEYGGEGSWYSNNFIKLYENYNVAILFAKQDGETIYAVSSNEQDA